MKWPAGWQNLVGSQTAGLLRRPVDVQDISAHCARQGEILAALINQHFRWENMGLANTVFRRLTNEMESNLTVADLQNLTRDMGLLAQSNHGELAKQTVVEGEWKDGLFRVSNHDEIRAMA